MVSYRVGVDIGGTFTDIVLLGADGTIHTKKVSSSVDELRAGHRRGHGRGVPRDRPRRRRRSRRSCTAPPWPPTPSSSRRAPRTGLITTKGFRDILEIRTLRMPRLYDIALEKPPPWSSATCARWSTSASRPSATSSARSIPRDAERAVDALLAEGVEAIAVCLLNSFANPAHELLITRHHRAQGAGAAARCISCEVLPEIKEYERTSTTVINAYVMPIVAQLSRALRQGSTRRHRGAAAAHAVERRADHRQRRRTSGR